MALTDPLSMQLYCARNHPPLDRQLGVIKDAGYTNVEPFGALYDQVPDLKPLLDRHGLSAKSGHVALAVVEGDRDRAIRIARTLGMSTVVVPYLPPDARPADRAGWTALGDRLAKAAEGLRREGLRLAWHNHDFEFAALPDGSLPIEHVLADGVLWEADLAWVTKGGADPKPWIERYRGRIPLVHVKDIAPAGQKADEDGWADVGSGTMPWPDLWARCVAAGAETMIAEHDNPSDFGRFARASAAAMRALAAGTEP